MHNFWKKELGWVMFHLCRFAHVVPGPYSQLSIQDIDFAA